MRHVFQHVRMCRPAPCPSGLAPGCLARVHCMHQVANAEPSRQAGEAQNNALGPVVLQRRVD